MKTLEMNELHLISGGSNIDQIFHKGMLLGSTLGIMGGGVAGTALADVAIFGLFGGMGAGFMVGGFFGMVFATPFALYAITSPINNILDKETV